MKTVGGVVRTNSVYRQTDTVFPIHPLAYFVAGGIINNIIQYSLHGANIFHIKMQPGKDHTLLS